MGKNRIRVEFSELGIDPKKVYAAKVAVDQAKGFTRYLILELFDEPEETKPG